MERAFTDKASGKYIQRPELGRLPGFLREGDTVEVHSMARLAALRRLVQKLAQRGIRIEIPELAMSVSLKAACQHGQSPLPQPMSIKSNLKVQ